MATKLGFKFSMECCYVATGPVAQSSGSSDPVGSVDQP